MSDVDFRRAMLHCLDCPATDTCESWLAASIEGREPPAFCPNIDLLRALWAGA